MVDFLSFFIILNTLFLWLFRDGTWLAIAILLISVCYKTSRINFFLGSFSFLSATLFLIWIVDFGFPNFFYWQPYDRVISLIPGEPPIYKKNKSVKMTQPFGSLRALANTYYPDDGYVLEYEPREIVFKTDSLGFRNDSDYTGQPFVLGGDSFVAGTTNTQEHTLSSILKSVHQADTYSMGVEGASLSNYVAI